MIDEETPPAVELPLDGVGQKLRHAREQEGLTLAQVAAETRIPERHLELIEQGAFGQLPARTYAIGFSRTYARLVGLDEFAIADEVRGELAMDGGGVDERGAKFEPGDPAKIPSAGLAWFGGFAAILLVAGAVAFYSSYFASGTGPAPLQPDLEPALAQQAPADPGVNTASPLSGDGQVAFTALEDGVWVRFYDAQGERLLEKQMVSGERFEIPSDAQGPQIWTGRPDAFAITIDGRTVPKLAEDDFVMRDVAISAEALLSRADDPQVPLVN